MICDMSVTGLGRWESCVAFSSGRDISTGLPAADLSPPSSPSRMSTYTLFLHPQEGLYTDFGAPLLGYGVIDDIPSGPSRRESRLYGLFNNKATPSSEPPPKPSLFNRLLGTPKTRTATEKGSGRKRKLVRKKVKASSTRASSKPIKQDAAGARPGERRATQRSTLQRDNSWDVIEKQRVPLSSVAIGVGGVAAVGGYFLKRHWAQRNERLITDFVDDMSLQKFQCLRCQRLTTLMPGQQEDDVFTPDYTCPQCQSSRDMIVRKS
ncbi:hypothetical protein NSK_004010 [Nannochloropsis salina CCMP1776]|uniref:Uncharacterized protein n=1 Tax=Nannochloropsis salina CCMP1776 TaxID=1027361 RepID=A0A4D9D0W1_9STRA|nr:hypothetical protein NSK_004010 [Nannochloropsis salina CCMP1776]|eukprot:TFJ84544.1 hypothetical protein NSK_004010 [Nannochloropsis salina CCMP1776]